MCAWSQSFLFVTDNRRSRLDYPFCVITQHRKFEFGHHRQSKKDKQCSGTDMQLSQTLSSAIAQISFKQPNYKSHKNDLAQAPSSFFQFLHNLKINFLYIVLMGGGGLFSSFFFLPLAIVVVEERFWGFNWCIPFIRWVRGVLPRKILENLECRKRYLPHFLDLFFIFLFFINQFSLFFLLFFKIFGLFFIF